MMALLMIRRVNRSTRGSLYDSSPMVIGQTRLAESQWQEITIKITSQLDVQIKYSAFEPINLQYTIPSIMFPKCRKCLNHRNSTAMLSLHSAVSASSPAASQVSVSRSLS